MKKIVCLLVFAVVVVACGTKQPKPGKSAPTQPNPQAAASQEINLWKIANYSGDVGDNKNSFYMTNASVIRGSYSSGTADNLELKVKFLIDKVSFCIKLYEYGNKIVKKGDENGYKITVRSDGNVLTEFVAKNVSDRLFVNDSDARKLIELFDKDTRLSFSLVSDSKTMPATYTFSMDNTGGFTETYKKLTE